MSNIDWSLGLRMNPQDIVKHFPYIKLSATITTNYYDPPQRNVNISNKSLMKRRHACATNGFLLRSQFRIGKILRHSCPCASCPLAHPQRFTMPTTATITLLLSNNNHVGSLFSLLKAATIHVWSIESWMLKSGSAKFLPLKVE